MKSQGKSAPPEYHLVDRLPGSTIPFLLGRIVANTRSPSDEYAPEDPRPALNVGGGDERPYLELYDEDFSTLFSAQRNSGAEARACRLLNIDFDQSAQATQSRVARVVRTRSLPQHREALASLLEHHRTAILRLLGDNGGTGHLIVGVKSCIDGSHGSSLGRTSTRKVELTLPTGLVVDAASHGVVQIGQVADISTGVESSRGWNAHQAGEMVGEQVFAIRYRKLTLKIPFLSKKGKYVQYGKVEHAQFLGGVYGQTDREEIEDDDEEEEDGGVVIDEAAEFEDVDVGLMAENVADNDDLLL